MKREINMEDITSIIRGFWQQFGVFSYIKMKTPGGFKLPHIEHTLSLSGTVGKTKESAVLSVLSEDFDEINRFADAVCKAIPPDGIILKQKGATGWVRLSRQDDFISIGENPENLVKTCEIKYFAAVYSDGGLQVDAGLLFRDFKLEGVNSADELREKIELCVTERIKYLGATRGGIEFRALPRVIESGMDGRMYQSETGCLLNGWDVRLSATLSEFTSAVFGSVLPNSYLDDQEDGFHTLGLKAKTGSGNDSIVWVGTLSGGDLLAIELKNAVNVEGVKFVSERDKEGGLKVGFKAFGDDGNMEEPPFSVYWFKEGECRNN
jgi:hypothetical protein